MEEKKHSKKSSSFFRNEMRHSDIEKSAHYTYRDGFRLGFGFFIGFLVCTLALILVVYIINWIINLF